MASSEFLKKLGGYIEDSTESFRDLHDKWDTYLDFYQGIQEEGVSLLSEELVDWTPINVIYSSLETRVPILCDAAPLWYAISLDGNHEVNAETLTNALQAVWHNRNVAGEYKRQLRDQLLLGTGAMKTWWNPRLGPLDALGERAGDVDVSWIDPYSIYPDPAATSLEQCEYLALNVDVAGERAKRLWGKFDAREAEQVDGDPARPWMNWLSRAYGWVGGTKNTSQYTYRNRDIYRVWEVYHDAGSRLTIYSGNNVLYDGEAPTPDIQYPISLFTTYERGYGIFGMAETSQTIKVQMLLNRLIYRIAHHARLMSNTPWVTNDPTFQASNEVGSTLRLMPGTEARREPPPPMPNYIFNFLQLIFEKYDTLTGVHDVTRGLRPGSVQSGVGIQQLQEAAQTRLRDAARDNARVLEGLGQQVLAVMRENYTEPRDLVFMRGGELTRATVEPDMFQRNLTPPWGAEEVSEPVEYRVVVQTGGDLPLNSTAEAELAIRLSGVVFPDGPAIDRQALLEMVKTPHRREIVSRIEQQQQAMMQGQMLSQGPPPTPEQGPPSPPPDGGPAPADIAAQLQMLLGPEQFAILDEILGKVARNEQITQNDNAFLSSLSPEVLQMVDQLMQIYAQLQG